ncbi:heterokaryon incompatibility protein-domain-containing protein [Cercophora newfieldiana]|uniref:Heterokaryon incompatibility protein-domain-containing protein n=1 Tax=Cercophora newfieldiana TaxID=92897 RepID=A0AA40CRC8_9PEZI|nr:heterokaryon incompatibility protein-domain-containing protein [Cercophora newfieldiana]
MPLRSFYQTGLIRGVPHAIIDENLATLGLPGEHAAPFHLQYPDGHEAVVSIPGLETSLGDIIRQSHTIWETVPAIPESCSPSRLCPVCSAFPLWNLGIHFDFGPASQPLKFTISPLEEDQRILRMWGRVCTLANFAYIVSSMWLQRDDTAWLEFAAQFRILRPLSCNSHLKFRLFLSIEHDIATHPDLRYHVIHRDPLSEPCRQRMLKWINSCDAEHECRGIDEHQGTLLPSRLLDVQDPERVVLRDTGGLKEKKDRRYATLSHCWGVSRSFLATKATLHHLQAGFSITTSGMPKTFRDAILVTRALGIPYLWIDSLCIMQDDKAEWDIEASRMADIYSNSYLTFAAASSEDDENGFLTYRSFNYATIELSFPSGERTCAYLSETKNHRKTHDSRDDPLFQRGWVLQEQFLSPRMIIFSSQQMFWVCRKGCLSESNDCKIEVLSRGHLDDGCTWASVVKEFTARQLTYETDKFPAIAGIASRFADGTGYCAGLWRQDLPGALLFRWIGRPATPARYIAPSWSWAALNGPTICLVDRCREFEYGRISPIAACRVVYCHIKLSTPDNLLGGVETGTYLRIQAHFGHLRRLPGRTIPRSLTEHHVVPTDIYGFCHDGKIYHDGQWIPSRLAGGPLLLRGEHVWCQFDRPDSSPDDVEALILASRCITPEQSKLYRGSHHNLDPNDPAEWNGVLGILISPITTETSVAGYRRVGIFEYHRKGWGKAQTILDAFPLRDVTLF